MLTVYYTMSFDCLYQIEPLPFSVSNPQDSILLQWKAEMCIRTPFMPNTEDKWSLSFLWMLRIFQTITKIQRELQLSINLEKKIFSLNTFWKAGAQSNVTGMNKYILRKIYLCDNFGCIFFSFSALKFQFSSSEISVFTGIKKIQAFCFLMICMIVEFSLEIKRETVFLDPSK